MLKDFSQSFERYSLAEKSEYLEISILVDQDLDSKEYSKLSEAHFLQLLSLAQNQLKCFLESRFIYEAVPENSKIIAVSSNLPLLITLSFLLEDKKKSLLVYDELEDCFIGSFTCFDALLIFYILYILVENETNQEIYDNFPFKSLEELSKCSIKSWLEDILETNESLSRKLITMSGTLYEGLKLCLDMGFNSKRIKLIDKEFNFNDLGTWVIEDRNSLFDFESLKDDLRTKSKGLYPICYFSPLTILSDLVQNLQICSGSHKKEFQKEHELTNNSDKDESFCDVSAQGSIFGRLFHNKVLKHLGIVKKAPKCLKSNSTLKLALEMFLKEGLTHIPVVTEEDEIFTGTVLTLEKCCMYLARCVSNQEKARMEDPIENIFNIDKEMYDAIVSAVVQLSGSNCGESCFEYNNGNKSEIQVNKVGDEREFKEENQIIGNTECESFNSSFLVDICLSGAISHILLSEDQCLVLVKRKTNQVTALLTALDICKLLFGAKSEENE